jgi:ElaB/YqjD/DUF883 family membrane-anchored ribosome-binding protein
MNSNYTTNQHSSEELKQEVLQDIHNVKRDLDEIRGRISPGQYIDSAIFKRKGMSFSDTFDRLKSNPVGTSLITLGVLCLMEDENHQSYESKIKARAHAISDKAVNAAHSAQDAVHTAQDKIHNAKDRIQNVQHRVQEKFQSSEQKSNSVGFEDIGLGEGMDVEGVSAKLQDTKENVSSKIQQTKENVSSKFQQTKENVSSKLSETKENVSSKFNETKDRVSEQLHSASDKVRTQTHDAIEYSKNLDPLTYIALGAGLGTITGASLPVSEKEKSLVDSKFEQNLSNFTTDLQDAINESANILKNEFIGGFTEINMHIFS